jgi:hypothetical protein
LNTNGSGEAYHSWNRDHAIATQRRSLPATPADHYVARPARQRERECADARAEGGELDAVAAPVREHVHGSFGAAHRRGLARWAQDLKK